MFHNKIYFTGEYHSIKVVQTLKGEIMVIIWKVLAGVPASVIGHGTPPNRKQAD